MAIIGGSGAGKTLIAMEIIKRMKNTFELLIICCKSKAEPLYEFLEESIPKGQLRIFEGAENVPDLNELKKEKIGQTLIIFDDLVLDKKQDRITEYFIRGRKVGGGISSIYISQSYFKTPKTIRVNCNYLILKRLSSMRDLRLILNDFAICENIKELTRIYKKATENKEDFLMIDVDAQQGCNFRKNFLEILEVS
jgi:hypothetical protein